MTESRPFDVRGQWPVVLVLIVLLVIDLESARGLTFARQFWAVPGALALVAIAVVAPMRPLLAGVGPRS